MPAGGDPRELVAYVGRALVVAGCGAVLLILAIGASIGAFLG